MVGKVEYLTYSPRYFGPNAFPIPELVGGSLSSRWEVELRGEYHKTRGDQTKDIFTRLYIPVVKGRVGVNVSWVFQEWYEMSPEVRDERYAVELKSPIVCRGDVIFNFYFQALRSEKWMDIVVSAKPRKPPVADACATLVIRMRPLIGSTPIWDVRCGSGKM